MYPFYNEVHVTASNRLIDPQQDLLRPVGFKAWDPAGETHVILYIYPQPRNSSVLDCLKVTCGHQVLCNVTWACPDISQDFDIQVDAAKVKRFRCLVRLQQILKPSPNSGLTMAISSFIRHLRAHPDGSLAFGSFQFVCCLSLLV
jgi:hypothetical protein